MKSFDAAKAPLLANLIIMGLVKVQGREYIGLASDGVWVNLGNVGSELQVEGYLAAHPSPDTW